ncbi:unnamed protein product [Protopolystoma xenopodis]|uniref:Uncharacterized protein n=1 Tax=Protopolystoma xenopodis TaxID=117903 RepID=A0A448X057_9PLAT|nr:unnamed protein product [Protopolystoma xenopodis]
MERNASKPARKTVPRRQASVYGGGDKNWVYTTLTTQSTVSVSQSSYTSAPSHSNYSPPPPPPCSLLPPSSANKPLAIPISPLTLLTYTRTESIMYDLTTSFGLLFSGTCQLASRTYRALASLRVVIRPRDPTG